MRKLTTIPLKYRRWVSIVAMGAFGLSAFVGVMGHDYVGVVWAASGGLFMLLTYHGYDTSPRSRDRVLYMGAGFVWVVLGLIRFFFLSAPPT